MWRIESTYKARDVEETIDIYFYRPVGYVIALASRFAGLTPNTITILSIVVGVIGGHLLYYPDVRLTIAGLVLFILADAMDSADGQLARMTNFHSRLGRILDGFGGNLIFLSMYIHLCARFIVAGGSPFILLLALAAGVSHSFQSAMADYYRNAYLYFVYGRGGDFERSAPLVDKYRRLQWGKTPVRKLLMRLYLNYIVQQELLAMNFRRLYATAREHFPRGTPQWLRDEYVRRNRPMLKYYNILTTNTRIIVLFACVFLDVTAWYFITEVVVFNGILAYVTARQQRINLQILSQIRWSREVARA